MSLIRRRSMCFCGREGLTERHAVLGLGLNSLRLDDDEVTFRG